MSEQTTQEIISDKPVDNFNKATTDQQRIGSADITHNLPAKKIKQLGVHGALTHLADGAQQDTKDNSNNPQDKKENTREYTGRTTNNQDNKQEGTNNNQRNEKAEPPKNEYISTKDFYERLGVSATATPEEIQKAYRRLAIKMHPDANPDPSVAIQFKDITDAYNILSDKVKRANYDTIRAYEQTAKERERNEQERQERARKAHAKNNYRAYQANYSASDRARDKYWEEREKGWEWLREESERREQRWREYEKAREKFGFDGRASKDQYTYTRGTSKTERGGSKYQRQPEGSGQRPPRWQESEQRRPFEGQYVSPETQATQRQVEVKSDSQRLAEITVGFENVKISPEISGQFLKTLQERPELVKATHEAFAFLNGLNLNAKAQEEIIKLMTTSPDAIAQISKMFTEVKNPQDPFLELLLQEIQIAPHLRKLDKNNLTPDQRKDIAHLSVLETVNAELLKRLLQ